MPRTRNNRIDIMLNDEEYYCLKDKINKSKLSLSEFVRSAIFNKEITEKPDYNFYKLLSSISKIGNNINQIAKSLNSDQDIDSEYLQEQGKLLKDLILDIRRRYG